MPSADLEAAVATAVDARVQNNGQSCIAAKRFIVSEKIAPEFERKFVQAHAGLTRGRSVSGEHATWSASQRRRCHLP